MTIAAAPYGLFMESLCEGRIDFRNDPMMCMLTTSAYTPNLNTHKFRSIVSNEIVGSGYVSGGKQVTGVALSYTGVSKKETLAGGPLSWPSVTWTGARYGVLYVARSSVPITAQPLVGLVDFGGGQNRGGEPFYITWPASGILSLVVP